MIRERTFHNLTLDRIHIGKPAGAAAVLESDLRGAKRVVAVFALADFFRETNADLVSPLVDGRRWIQ